MTNSTNTSSFSNTEISLGDVDIKYAMVYGVIYPIICILGIFGNILTLLITCKQRKSSSSTYLITGLSMADTLALSSRLLYVIYRICQVYFTISTISFSKYIPSTAVIRLNMLMKRISKLILIPVSLERLVAIWFPLRYRATCTPKIVKIALVVIVLVVSGFNVPVIVDAIIFHRTVINSGGTVFSGKFATIRELERYNANRTVVMKDLVWVNRCTFDLLPITFVLLADLAIVTGIRSNIRRFEKSCSNSTMSSARKFQTKQLTRMLLGICCAFVVLCLPADLLSIAVNFFGITGLSPNYYIITDILASTNHAVNFIFYCACNPAYRQMYLRFVTCRKTELPRFSSRDRSQSLGSSEQMHVSGSNVSVTTVL